MSHTTREPVLTASASAIATAARTGDLPAGVPDLDDVSGTWIDADSLLHLPSLRNQWGQGHVNHDLTSLSWVAAPPYTFGYHTGLLRLDGQVPTAHRFRWKPWGVQRANSRPDGVTVTTDTRMALRQDLLLWQIEVANDGDRTVSCTLSQDLYAMVAHTETGWGWLYDVPWTCGNQHDFMTLERIRATTAGRPDAPYLLGPGPRLLRLGKPRLPGIQRDAGSEAEAMSLADALPRHVSRDTIYPHQHGVDGQIRRLSVREDAAGPALLDLPDPVTVTPDGETAVDSFVLNPGSVVEFELRLTRNDRPGIVLTHGNHPDSLQIGVDAGRLWLNIGGESASVEREIEPGQWYRVRVVLDEYRAELHLDDAETAATAATGHWTASARWKATLEGPLVAIADTASPARACYAFATAPDVVEPVGSGARATWALHLEPGERRTIGLVCAFSVDAEESAQAATAGAEDLPTVFDETERGWHALWHAAFTPGNDEFSGHLPSLGTEDAGLSASYYMAALLALYMRNTRISPGEPVFLTGGPRLGPTTTYFWDHTEWSRLYALLEPAGLRSWLLRALASPYNDCFGFDTRGGGPLGNDYVSNHYSLFRLVEHYVGTTGDVAFLDEQAADRTVAEHLRSIALSWKDKQTPETGGVLADFGPDPWLLLECVPNYVNAVASFNAAYVGMTRALAALLRLRGRTREAAAVSADAEALAGAVCGMALPDGTWQIRHPGRTESIGHSLDFGLTAAYLHDDLSEPQRERMVDFVTGKLLDSTWMHALSPQDPAAALANRPDHGSAGAFCAWPGVTAYGLTKLGRADLARGLLSRVHESASGALWGQAVQIVTDEHGTRVQVAEDGVSNRDSIAGVATAEAVVAGLFGFEPGFAALAEGVSLPRQISVPGIGVLSNLNVPIG